MKWTLQLSFARLPEWSGALLRYPIGLSFLVQAANASFDEAGRALTLPNRRLHTSWKKTL